MRSEPPIFSIIIPTYNRAEKLRRCLASIVEQTFKGYEVIVVDDGSSDSTRDVVNTFENCLPLTYRWTENWGGPARPRNLGAKLAKGTWLCFLDSDDWWDSNKLDVVSRYISNSDVIYHDLAFKTEAGSSKKLFQSRKIHRAKPFTDLFVNGNAIMNSSALVRKEIFCKVGGFSEDRALISAEDYDLWLRVAQLGPRFCYIQQILGSYWVEPGDSISRAEGKLIQITKILGEKYRRNVLPREYQRYCGRYEYLSAMTDFASQDFNLARHHFLNSLFWGSWTLKLKSVVRLVQTLVYA